jgi:hypothetical protein
MATTDRSVLTRAWTAHLRATSPAARILTFGSVLGVAAVGFVASVADFAREPASRTVADGCTGVVVAGVVGPVCGPGLSGGSVSPGAPSEGLITAKNQCNLIFGGCSSAFFYPPGPAVLPNVDNSVRHSP